MLGIAIRPTIGVGDALQFSSVPENYYRAKGERLVDVNKHWFFDFNPYVLRDVPCTNQIEMWNFSPAQWPWPKPRKENEPQVYLSQAEIFASVFKVPVVMNRPRLYRYEDFPYHERELILLHTDGVSHGNMPEHVIQHVIKKYEPTGMLHLVGTKIKDDYGLPVIKTATLWDLARVISRAKLFIGVDSGPSWIAACFPDVVVKKLRTKPYLENLKEWIPLEIKNIHSHWDDRSQQIFNVSEDDIGFTYSYRRI